MKAEDRIKKVLFSNLKNPEKYKVFLFWSRVKWDYKKNSDYDIWIIWEKKLGFIELLRLKRKLEELPYLIDLVDFNNAPKDFKALALKNTKKWN